MRSDIKKDEKVESGVFGKFKSIKSITLLIIGVIAGLLLIFIGNTDSKNAKINSPDTEKHLDMTDKYIEDLEVRLTQILSKMDGIGDVSVIITADSCIETVYAQNGRYDGGSLTEKEYVIIDSNGNDTPITVKLVYPKIRGVAVVCRGGSNPINQEKITTLVSSLFDIAQNRVYVSG